MAQFEQLHSGIRITQSDDLFRIGTDSMVLADFAPLRGVRTAADLGCGNGCLGFLLLGRAPGLQITGIELQAAACALARQNIADNNLQAQYRLIEGDLRQIPDLLPANGFDCVVSNPPYFPIGSGFNARDEAFAIARTERCCTPDDLCRAAKWLLHSGGSFCLVHRPERLADLICALRAHRLEPKRLRLVRHHPGAQASILLLDSRLDGKPGLQLEPDLTLFDENGQETAEYRRIYHR